MTTAASGRAHLMRPADEVEVMLVQKLLHDIWAKREGNATIVVTPPSNVLVRVRP